LKNILLKENTIHKLFMIDSINAYQGD